MTSPRRQHSQEPADSRRVAACLKACEGVPTEKLEGDIWLRLVAACIHVDDDEVRAILEELSPIRPRLVARPPSAAT
jgi:hypothetical protein